MRSSTLCDSYGGSYFAGLKYRMNLALLAYLANQIEGPYKRYIIAGILLLLSIIFARFVFRTLKWLILLLALLLLGFLLMQWWKGA